MTLWIDLISIPLCGDIFVLMIFPLVYVHHAPLHVCSVTPNKQQLIPY